MYVTPEKIAATNKAGVDAVLALASAQFSAIEKLAALNISAARNAFSEVSEHVKSLAEAKDAQELIKINTAFAQPNLEKSVAYGKSVYDIAAQTQATVTKLAEGHAAEINRAFVTLLDSVAKNAPAGSDPMVTAMKTALAAVNSAYDNMTKAAKQAAEVVEVNFAAATQKPRRKAA
jgi:phasin family protein